MFHVCSIKICIPPFTATFLWQHLTNLSDIVHTVKQNRHQSDVYERLASLGHHVGPPYRGHSPKTPRTIRALSYRGHPTWNSSDHHTTLYCIEGFEGRPQFWVPKLYTLYSPGSGRVLHSQRARFFGCKIALEISAPNVLILCSKCSSFVLQMFFFYAPNVLLLCSKCSSFMLQLFFFCAPNVLLLCSKCSSFVLQRFLFYFPNILFLCFG